MNNDQANTSLKARKALPSWQGLPPAPYLLTPGCVQISGRTLPQVAAKNRSLFNQNLREGASPPKMNAPYADIRATSFTLAG
jgi:hypothetical protein